MEHVGNGLAKRFSGVINVINVDKSNNDNNVNSFKRKKYALDRNKFTPNTETTQMAEKISSYFNDLDNYAFYLRVVNKLGIPRAYSFWRDVQEEIEKKKNTEYFIRNPKKYFTWRFRKGFY